jgi:hypothetical protein
MQLFNVLEKNAAAMIFSKTYRDRAAMDISDPSGVIVTQCLLL